MPFKGLSVTIPCFEPDLDDGFTLPAQNSIRPPKPWEESREQCREQSKEFSRGDETLEHAAQARAKQDQEAAAAAAAAAQASAIRQQEAAAAAAAQAQAKRAAEAAQAGDIQRILLLGDPKHPSTLSSRLQFLTQWMGRKVDPIFQAAAATALSSLASSGHACQEAIAQDGYCIDALGALLHSSSTEVLKAAMAALMTLTGDAASPAVHAALGRSPPLVIALEANLKTLSFIFGAPGIASDIIHLMNFVMLRDGVLLCVDLCNRELSNKNISPADVASVARAVHSLACLQYSDYYTAARVVPQFLQKMMVPLLGSNDPRIQALALDAVQCLAKNKFIDSAIIQRSRSLFSLMMAGENEGWMSTAAKALHALLAAAGPDACDALMEDIYILGWVKCLKGLEKMSRSSQPPEMKILATKILTLLVEGSRTRQDRVLMRSGIVYRLVALLHSTNEAVQLAGLETLCSLAAGNNNAVLMIKAQTGVDYVWGILKMHFSSSGPLRTAALKSERIIPTAPYVKPPEKSPTWQEAVIKALKTFTSYAMCQQSCMAARELSQLTAASCTGWTPYGYTTPVV